MEAARPEYWSKARRPAFKGRCRRRRTSTWQATTSTTTTPTANTSLKAATAGQWHQEGHQGFLLPVAAVAPLWSWYIPRVEGGKRARDVLPPSTWPFLPAFKLVLAVAVVVVLVVNRLVLVRRPGLGNLDFYFILHAHLSRDQRLHYDTMGWFLKWTLSIFMKAVSTPFSIISTCTVCTSKAPLVSRKKYSGMTREGRDQNPGIHYYKFFRRIFFWI